MKSESVRPAAGRGGPQPGRFAPLLWRQGSLLAPLLAATLVSACSPQLELVPEAEAPVTPLPAQFSGAEVAGSYQPAQWWQAFADPVLDRALEVALESNLDLSEAVARVEQARAREQIVRAPAFPLLQPAADITDTDVPANANIAAQLDEVGLGPGVFNDFGIMLPERIGLRTYTLSATFSYELDFWGRNRNDALAAGALRQATQADYQTVRMGVLAETVRAYLDIAALRRQQVLADQRLEIVRLRTEITELRYQRGLVDRPELRRARQARRDAQAGLPQLQAQLALVEGQFWTLLGGYRADLAELLPEAPAPAVALAPPPPGIPADLLQQRPDVSAASRRVDAARHTVGARRADLLPSLSLYGSIGLQSAAASEWFDPDQWFRNLSFNLLGPVFQGGRLRSNVALAEARLKEAIAAYGRAVVTAVNEVESALLVLAASRRRYSLLEVRVQAARAEAGLQERRYLAGTGDYTTFLNASEALLGAQSAVAAAARELGLARLTLHRALGGAWAADAHAQQDAAPGAPARLAMAP